MIILLTLKFSSFSQTALTPNNQDTTSSTTTSVVTELKKGEYPIILKYNGSTLVCFTMEQARQMAKEIRDCDIDAEIIIKYESDQKIMTETITQQKTLIDIKDKQINLYKSKEIDFNNKLANKNTEIVNLNLINKDLSNKVLKYKIATFSGFSLAIAIPVVLLLLKK